jgi:hypothetical protein
VLPNISGTFLRFPTRAAVSFTAQVFRNYYFSPHFVKCFSKIFSLFFARFSRAKTRPGALFSSTPGAPLQAFFQKTALICFPENPVDRYPNLQLTVFLLSCQA